MVDGMEINEAPEPQEKKEVQVSPEKQAETREVAEVQRATDKATVSPEAVVEKGDPQAAENLEEAFKAAVSPPEQVAETSPATRPAEGAVSPPETPRAASEVQPVAAEVSTAAPTVTLEGSGEEGKVTIAEAASETPSLAESQRTSESNAEEFLQEAGQPEIQEAAKTVPASEQAEQTQNAAIPDLETIERDDGETKLVKDGGADDQYDPDDGLEQAGDIREDTLISDQYGDDVIETGDGVDTLRDPTQPGKGIDDIPNTIPDFTPGEGGGMEPGNLNGGPDTGLDQDGERGGLASAAAFGSDSRVSAQNMDAAFAAARGDSSYENSANNNQSGNDYDTGNQSRSSRSAQAKSELAAIDADLTDNNQSKNNDADTTPRGDDGGNDNNSSDTSSDNNSDDSEESKDDAAEKARKAKEKKEKQQQQQKNKKQQSTSSTSTKKYDPEGYEIEEFDETTIDGKLRAQAFSNLSSVDQELGDEAVSQPVDEDGASPKEPGIAFDRENQTDPYSQDTVDGGDAPSTGYIPDEKSKFKPGMAGGDDGVLDPNFGAVDPNKPTGEHGASGDEGPKPTKPNNA